MIWSYFFHNKKTSVLPNLQLHVCIEVPILEDYEKVLEGHDAAFDKLLKQAAIARTKWNEDRNSRVSWSTLYLKANNLMLNPTDKNFVLDVFTVDVYRPALAGHLTTGPY